jgi:aspartyl-tRNA(Asn)/glutamyl-tRNA(Gln) amidotransferase subunit C
MAITREDVLHLAKLSNISLSEEQIEPLMKDLDSIVGYISQLDELDTEGVEPTYQCFDMQNVWREDVIEEFEANREDLLNLTTESEDHQIKVPKVL